MGSCGQIFSLRMEGGSMYFFYPMALLAGIAFYFMMNSLDQDGEAGKVKGQQTVEAGPSTGG